MQLADEELSHAMRRDRRLRDRRERADASVWEHGTRKAVQVNSTRQALGIYYSDILFRRVQTLAVLGTCSFESDGNILSSDDTSGKIVTGLNRSNKIGPQATLLSPTFTHNCVSCIEL